MHSCKVHVLTVVDWFWLGRLVGIVDSSWGWSLVCGLHWLFVIRVLIDIGWVGVGVEVKLGLRLRLG